MKYVFQFARIMGLWLVGELLHRVLPLPIPAGIYGLVLLAAALLMGVVKLEQVKQIFSDFVTIQKHNANDYSGYSAFKSHFMNFVRTRAKAIWADKSQQQTLPKKVIEGPDVLKVYG